ncbi:MAG: peptidoglycan DD-metalloendopeptidase family protein [Gammaproteobacteria bacterium]
MLELRRFARDGTGRKNMKPGAWLRLLAAALLLSATTPVTAQSLYKYQDADGNWVYTDRRPAVEKFEEERLESRRKNPVVTVRGEKTAEGGSALIVTNEYVAPVEVLVELTDHIGVASDVPKQVRVVVPPSSEEAILEVRPGEPNSNWSFGYTFQYLPGDPATSHNPEGPYRAPFAPATSFPVSQAYPSAFSHQDVASRYAVDFAMPIGTPVYSARAGLVMDVAAQFFESGTDLDELGMRANLVRVLHEDGTMAIYAHLNWHSIRVQPGEAVERGQYIADSGNTGFTTGPHLHFVVQRNAGLVIESVPVDFAGPNGEAITPRTGEPIAAF